MSDECKHGSLTRSCEICERDDEIDRLRAEVKFWNETAIEYKRQLNETIRRGPESAGLHIITTDQINAAWELWSKYKDMGARAALAELGIFACLGCGGSGVQNDVYDLGKVIHEQSCAICNGHGWVMKGV